MRQLIGCSRCYGRHYAAAWETNTPGLVIVDTSTAKHARVGALPYTVTHARSGLRITAHDDFKDAHATAAALGATTVDWTQSGDAVANGMTDGQRAVVSKIIDGHASPNQSEGARTAAAKLRAS